jgi:hypothetical protein
LLLKLVHVTSRGALHIEALYKKIDKKNSRLFFRGGGFSMVKTVELQAAVSLRLASF